MASMLGSNEPKSYQHQTKRLFVHKFRDKTGGPAFPLGNTPEDWMNGMNLRDYFAAKAIPQLMVHFADRLAWEHNTIAAEAYLIADAMLKARGNS